MQHQATTPTLLSTPKACAAPTSNPSLAKNMSERSNRSLVMTAIIAMGIITVAGGALLVQYRENIPPLEDLRAQLIAILESVPAPLYFMAFAIMPAFGVPLSLFYLTALTVMGSGNIFVGLALGILAVALNIAITNLVSRSFLHPVIERIIRKRNLSIPKIKPENEWKLVAALRVSPIPFAIQNYLLSLGHSRWRYYLGLSIVIQGAIGVTIMLVGESILKGGLGYVLLAVFAFLALNLAVDYFRKRLGKDREGTDG